MPKPTYYGYTMPFASRAGILPLQADERLIKNDLMTLLLTITGERVMRPSFGTEINRYTFEMSDPNSLDGLRRNIIQAITRNDQRIVIDDVIVKEGTGSNVLNIVVIARIAINPDKTFNLELNIPLPGGA